MNKNILSIAIAALGFVIGLGLLGNAIKNRNKSENTISVTGLGTKQFTSDLITWSGSFSKNNFDLKSAYDELVLQDITCTVRPSRITVCRKQGIFKSVFRSGL